MDDETPGSIGRFLLNALFFLLTGVTGLCAWYLGSALFGPPDYALALAARPMAVFGCVGSLAAGLCWLGGRGEEDPVPPVWRGLASMVLVVPWILLALALLR